MADLNVKLKNDSGDILYPQAKYTNIVDDAGDVINFDAKFKELIRGTIAPDFDQFTQEGSPEVVFSSSDTANKTKLFLDTASRVLYAVLDAKFRPVSNSNATKISVDSATRTLIFSTKQPN